jgi:hypothetical protein
VRGWRFIGRGGDHGQKNRFSKPIRDNSTPFLFVSADGKRKNNFVKGWQSSNRLKVDLPLVTSLVITLLLKKVLAHVLHLNDLFKLITFILKFYYILRKIVL